MKQLRKITALLLTAVMIAVSAVSASAVNIKYYNKDFDIDEIFAGATAAESGKTYQSYICAYHCLHAVSAGISHIQDEVFRICTFNNNKLQLQ